MLQHNVLFANQPQNPSAPAIPPSSNSMPSISPAAINSDPSLLFNALDASSSAAHAKQLAALNAAGIARRASQSGGTSGSFLGGTPFAQQTSSFRNPSSLPHDVANPNQSLPLFAMSSSSQMPPPSDPSGMHRQSTMPNSSNQTGPAISKGRKPTLLDVLAQIMSSRNTPLPPSVTGVLTPAYDPATSPWKNLEPASQIGGFKIAGKDIDLQKLWSVTHPPGVTPNLSQPVFWTSLLSHFDLPEQIPHPQGNGSIPTPNLLAQHYMSILAPVDEYYRNLQEQRKIVMGRTSNMAGPQQDLSPQSGFVGQSTSANGTSINHQTNSMQFSSQNMSMAGSHPSLLRNTGDIMSMHHQSQGGHSLSSLSPVHSVEQPHFNQAANGSGPADANATPADSDLEAEARKRKFSEFDDMDVKRVRRKTDSEPPATPSHGSGSQRFSQPPPGTPINTSNTAGSSRSQPMRKKIEYVPLAREVYTYGGRDTRQLEIEMTRSAHGRPLRDVDDWGTVDIDSLTMSLRSRISTELSYSLTTIALLSSMRVNGPHTGFPILQCPELMDEMLDLLEEVAFDGLDEPDDIDVFADGLVTNRELVKYAYEDGIEPFAGLAQKQGTKSVSEGHRQRPGDIVRLIINCLRNFSAVHDNQVYLAQHPDLLNIALRVATLAPSDKDTKYRAASLALSLSDLIIVRKDVLQIFANLAAVVRLTSSAKLSTTEKRRTARVFHLITSYLVDPEEALTPVNWLLYSGSSISRPPRPPILPDNALDVFTRISQPDQNRQAFSQALPDDWIWSLFESLIRRLPIVDHDFQVILQDLWASYVEKLVMAIYSLAFLMPPDMKSRVKNDRFLGFTPLMLRLVRKLTIHPHNEYKNHFNPCARRAVEAMKVIDSQADSFDTSQSNLPVLSFGMGYGEVGDKHVERGTGLLGAHQDEVVWGIMLQPEVESDDVMFNELESLARVDFN